MPTRDYATFSMRLDTRLLARIDHDASQAGMTRTAYVLSYLPEYYEPLEPIAEHQPKQTTNNDR